MTHAAIIVQRKGDEPTHIDERVIVGNLEKFIISEGATSEGKTGVTLIIDTKDGSKTVATTTAAIMNGFASALKGAEDLFQNGKPNEITLIEDMINTLIEQSKPDTNIISDGYHTFGELYEHRTTNYLALCRIINQNRTAPVWKSKNHSDGELAFGGTWFLLGINTEPGKQITYHLPIEAWDKCNFVELEKAPEWDGHTSADVLERIAQL